MKIDFRKAKIKEFEDFNKIYVQISKTLDGLNEEEKFAVLMSILNVECSNYLKELKEN